MRPKSTCKFDLNMQALADLQHRQGIENIAHKAIYGM